MMKDLLLQAFILLLPAAVVESWVPVQGSRCRSNAVISRFMSEMDEHHSTASLTSGSIGSCSSRQEFLKTAPNVVTVTAVWLAAGATTAFPTNVQARGRATLEQAYDRYVPRISAGGDFYARDLRAMIERNDWTALVQATAEPPPKSKEDRSKPDGGVADRLAKAGQFSDARVITACDLFAGGFSDNSVSAKTKKMRSQVEILREVVAGINLAAREALGEAPSGGGGVFGLGGGKKPSATELAKQVRALYVKGGNAWNQYIFAANEGLPIQYKKLPFLK